MLKKIFAGLMIVSALALAGIYLLVPSDISIQNTVIISTTDIHVFQFLTNKKQWSKWWPGKAYSSSVQYQYKNNLYTIQHFNNDEVALVISNPELTLNTQIFFISTDAGNVKVTWGGVKTVSLNPVARLNTYLQVRRTLFYSILSTF